MSRLVELQLRPPRARLRNFGFVALVAFGALAFLARNGLAIFAGLHDARLPVAVALAGVGALSAIFSLTYPPANRPLYVALTLISFPIGFALSYVLMAVLFFGVFGLVALVMRLLGRDPLHRRYDPKAATYWSTPRRSRGNDSYFRQF
jgi:hypothetical protein